MTKFDGFRKYSDQEDLFEVYVPDRWLAITTGELGTRVAFVMPDNETDFRPNFNIIVQHVPPLTRTEYLTLTRLQLKQLSRSSELARDDAIPATDSHVFEWNNEHAPQPVWSGQQIFFLLNKSYVTTATCLKTQKAELQMTFQTMFDSFRLATE